MNEPEIVNAVAQDEDAQKNTTTVTKPKRCRKRNQQAIAETKNADKPDKPEKKHRNRPDLQRYGYENCSEEDISRYVAMVSEALFASEVDLDDYDQIYQRIQEYFQRCEHYGTIPGVAGLANALHCDRTTLYYWAKGQKPTKDKRIVNLISSVYQALEELWEIRMAEQKGNPANLIFLGKNHFNYADRAEIVVTPNTTTQELSEEEIVQKYRELPSSNTVWDE